MEFTRRYGFYSRSLVGCLFFPLLLCTITLMFFFEVLCIPSFGMLTTPMSSGSSPAFPVTTELVSEDFIFVFFCILFDTFVNMGHTVNCGEKLGDPNHCFLFHARTGILIIMCIDPSKMFKMFILPYQIVVIIGFLFFILLYHSTHSFDNVWLYV